MDRRRVTFFLVSAFFLLNAGCGQISVPDDSSNQAAAPGSTTQLTASKWQLVKSTNPDINGLGTVANIVDVFNADGTGGTYEIFSGSTSSTPILTFKYHSVSASTIEVDSTSSKVTYQFTVSGTSLKLVDTNTKYEYDYTATK